MRDPAIRASDSDRDEVASMLRDNLAEGRLSIEEFNERLEATYGAKTYGDLDALLTDLPRPPGTGPMKLADAKGQLIERWEARRANRYRRSWSRFVTVNAVIWVVWAASLLSPGRHNLADLWPLWLTVPWGALLIVRRPAVFACRCRRDFAHRGRY